MTCLVATVLAPVDIAMVRPGCASGVVEPESAAATADLHFVFNYALLPKYFA